MGELVSIAWVDSGSSGGQSWATAIQHQEDVHCHTVFSIGHVMAEDEDQIWLAMGVVWYARPEERIYYNIASIWKKNILRRETLTVSEE